MNRSVFRLASVCAGLACLFALPAAGTAEATEVTIGANVNQTTSESGTCGFESASERPCTIVTDIVLGGIYPMTSPCDGTITRFRLNGIPHPLNSYSLRVVHRNGDGSFTGTATSAPVTIATEGVNEYATALPIGVGELLGIDFLGSTEEHGLRWVGGGPAVSAAVLFHFPADGTAAFADIPSTTFYYLFNADIACGTTAPAPSSPLAPAPVAPAVPSNAFHVVSLKKTTLTLSLASAGSVKVSEAAPKKKAKAGKKATALLKPASASGGPGPATVKLVLTGAAKATLRRTGKVKVKASLAFTPTGGTTATQVRTLTVKGPRKR